MSLFGSAATSGRSSSKNLVEFRAGKMHLKGTTVTPDKRKGLLYLYQSEDSLMHFCWKDRTSGNVEDDLIIFPDDCEFKRVTQCTTGRVYILKFKSSSRKFFFWVQEPKTDKDEENCKKVNDTLNNPPAPGSSGGGRGTGGMGGLPPELAGLGGEAGLQNMLGNMDQQQLLQLLGGGGLGGLGGLGSSLGLAGLMGPGAGRSGSSQSNTSSAAPSRVQSSPGPRPSSGTPASQTRPATAQPTTSSATSSTTTTSASGSKESKAAVTPASTPATGASSGQAPIQLSDLQNILSNLNIPNPGAAAQEQQPPMDMTQVLSSEAMTPILASPELQQRLLPYLPEGELLPRNPEQLRTTLQNPQFQQALNMFTAAFQSGQLGPLMAQFGLGEKATEAANKGDLVAFSQALQGGTSESEKSDGKEEAKKEEKKDDKKEDKDDKKKDEPEEMSLD